MGGGMEERGLAAFAADGGAEDELVVDERGEGGDGRVAVAFEGLDDAALEIDAEGVIGAVEGGEELAGAGIVAAALEGECALAGGG